MKRFNFIHIYILIIAIYFTPPILANTQLSKMDPSFEKIPIQNIKIFVQNETGDISYWQNLAGRILGLKTGELLTRSRLEKALKSIYLSKKFFDVQVDIEKTNERLFLQFKMNRYYYIQDIQLKGAYPLFEDEIFNAMTIYVGDIYDPKMIDAQPEKILKVFQDAGFQNTQVQISEEKNAENGNFMLQVDINKGDFAPIEAVDIKGNQYFSNARLKPKLLLWRKKILPGMRGRFIQKDLTADIENLTQFYWRKGFFNCQISHKTTVSKTGVSVEIKINEGSLYEVDIIGNDEIWGFFLKDDIILYEKGNIRDRGVRKSIQNMRKRYKEKGFLHTRVKLEKTIIQEAGPRKERLTFVITEGVFTRINQITISGNTQVDKDTLKGQILSRTPSRFDNGSFNPETLASDVLALQNLYFSRGFRQSRVEHQIEWAEDKSFVNITININEGVKTIVSDFTLEGLTACPQSEALSVVKLKKGQPYRDYMLKGDENALSALISEYGYPHVKVTSQVSLSTDETQAQVIYHVDQGPQVFMGQVFYFGNFKTKPKIIAREIHLEPQKPFSLKKMVESQRKVRDLDVFKSVQYKTMGLIEQNDEVNLLIEVEEKKPYFFQLGGGYESDTGLNTHLKLGDHNFLGTNKKAGVILQLSEIAYGIDTYLKEPRLFGSKISAHLNLYAEDKSEFNQDFGTTTYGSSLGFQRQFYRYYTGGLLFRLEQKDQYAIGSAGIDPADEDAYGRRTIFTITPSINYDSRDNMIRPKSGIFASTSVDLSNGFENQLDDFLKYQLDLRNFYSPFTPITIATLGRLGYIQPLNSEEKVPEDQLFYLGGISDIRAFRENMLFYNLDNESLGGRQSIVFSLELRLDVAYNFEIDLFYDIGKLAKTFETPVWDDYRSTVGLGLRYISPIGPVGFLYGIDPDHKKGDTLGRFHFSLGYTF